MERAGGIAEIAVALKKGPGQLQVHSTWLDICILYGYTVHIYIDLQTMIMIICVYIYIHIILYISVYSIYICI